jgi:hypothetical protein
VQVLAFSAEGHRLAAGGQRNLRIWDTEQEERLLDIDVPQPLDELQWSLDGRSLIHARGAIGAARGYAAHEPLPFDYFRVLDRPPVGTAGYF